MPSFFGLNIAMSGLRAQQYALDITAHNIANAATEGYHRQEAVFEAGDPLKGSCPGTAAGSPILGTGVAVQTVRRMQSAYIDNQVRMANQQLGSWDYTDQALRQVETVLAEPSNTGISAFLDKFWKAWSDASTLSENSTAKRNVVEAGTSLCNQIHELANNLRQLQMRADQDVQDSAAQINRMSKEIASYNEQIRGSIAEGYQPNDLMDKRDVLVEQLSKIINIDVSGQGGSEMIVSVGGQMLIKGNQVAEMKTAVGPGGWSQVQWAETDQPVELHGGNLAAQLRVRDEVIEGYSKSLDEFARKLADAVNGIHMTGLLSDGSTAANFFTIGANATSIEVNPDLIADPRNVATGFSGKIGDNELAMKIADLRKDKLADGNTLLDTYADLVGQIGSQAREAASRTDLYSESLSQLKIQRDTVSGVSLDEEMLNMVKFQQAYNACARIFTVMDELIDTVINRTGA